ncbi:gliding motility-associated ABC transporter ATP-binding subunit GldA [Bacteroidota bacterium]
MSVLVENLTKLYGSQKAVDSISFEVKRGEVVGFLGPNGAGKSTTMKIISCYTLPSSGSVHVNGFDIYEQSLKVREKIGYLPEQNPVYEDMYVKEYLLFIAGIHKLGKLTKKRVEEMIDLTGISPERHKKIGELSKGYRQRVGLAQALIHDPDVLLLDEPTSGLDPNQVVEIRKLISEIGKTKTVILSSHIMQEVQAMCNRVIIINKGKIVADDQTDKLLKDFSGRIVIRVEFKNPVKENELKALKGIEKVVSQKDAWLFNLRSQEAKEEIFNFAKQTNNAILEMKTEGENLENVFQQLTAENKS